MSLLPLVGMFIFGGKKKKRTENIYGKLAKEYGLTVDQVKKIGDLLVYMKRNLPELVANADPEKDVKKIYKILDVKDMSAVRGCEKHIYISSIEDHKYHMHTVEKKDPNSIKLEIMHPFLALALSHIAKSSSKQVGHVIGEAFDNMILAGIDYEKVRSDPEKLAEYILIEAKERGIPVKEEDKEKLIIAIQKAAKIAAKLTDDASEERLDALHQALVEKTDDPLYVLKRNGIDIEPELEEFRQFLAEISGKKIEPKGFKARKVINEEIPPEVLSIAKALEFSDFSEKAMEKAEKELLKLVDRLIEEEDAAALFHAVKLLRLVQKGNVEGIKRFGG